MVDAFSGVVAQDAAIRTLRSAAQNDRVASAYLFEGPSGVGKHLAARALAIEVLSRGVSAAERESIERRVLAGTHPDVRAFAPRDEGHRNLEVATIREQILPYTQFAPFEARAAFVILPEADVSLPEIHPEGANALLKTIEEPRSSVHFVLLSERPDRLLVTIRSRCQRVRFGRLPEAALGAILDRAGAPPETRTAAIALADGRADRAMALVQGGTADALLETALRIDDVTTRRAPGELVALAEELAKSPDLERTLSALATFYRDVAAASLGMPDGALAFRHRADRIRERAKTVSPARASLACERLRELEERLEQNANKEIALGKLLFGQ